MRGTKLAQIKPICASPIESPGFIDICFVWLLTFRETQNIVNLILSMLSYFAVLKKYLIKFSTTSLTLSTHCKALLEMWCSRRIEIIWTDRVRNEEVLQRINEERNVLHRTNRRKTNWIGHIMRRNCLLKHVIDR